MAFIKVRGSLVMMRDVPRFLISFGGCYEEEVKH